MYLNSLITFPKHYERKENLGYWIPSGVSQGQVMFSSTFLLNCRCLQPYTKLKLINLAFVINHQFVEKKNNNNNNKTHCQFLLGFLNASIQNTFQKLKFTAVLI